MSNAGADRPQEAAELKPGKPAKEVKKTCAVMFAQNRSFELHVAGVSYQFQPYETKQIPAEVVESAKFKSYLERGFFNVFGGEA